MRNKRKIGIITCGKESNYGACLQAFATYHTIKKMGYDVELMNYSFQSDKPYLPFNKPSLKSTISSLLFFFPRRNRWQAFEGFRNRYMKYSDERLYNVDDFKRVKSNYDVFLVGSDQVWNPELGIDIDITLLTFYNSKDGPNKISYASSMGLDKLPNSMEEKYRKALLDFEKISVREKSGVQIVKQLTQKECSLVSDPVLLLSKEEWNEFIDESVVPKEPYIFIYDMRHSRHVQECALDLAKKYDCKVIACASVWLGRKGIETHLSYSPSQYLALIKNAKAVVTDSFHGTVFSIIFQKEFYAFSSGEGKKIGGRLSNILQIVHLENRLLEIFDKTLQIPPIDYASVNKDVAMFRNNSWDYLKKALNYGES